MSRYPQFSFTYTPAGHGARLGTITTPHGTLQTPAFIFCATKATLKGVPMHLVAEEDTQIILSNTYHLMLQPGADVVAQMGGLHAFCGWKGPMLTDSGGFQIFSLGHGLVAEEIKGKRSSNRPKTLTQITEEGALFKSYISGASYLLTPEKSIDVQRKLGADLIVVFDECTPFHVTKDYTAESMRRSHRWEQRSLQEFDRFNDGKQALYGIIQGGVYEDLRKESVDFVNSHDFFGHAIGGSLGANKDQMDAIVHSTARQLAPNQPIHLLGIGGIRDIFKGVQAGIDTFDCVHPTRLGRHGSALVKGHTREHINLRNAAYTHDAAPIDPDCPCLTCRNYTRAYLHHLLKAKELLAFTLITIHNIRYMNRLMAAIRKSLSEGTFLEEMRAWIGNLDSACS